MGDLLSQGYAFELDDIWRKSLFLTERDDGSLFKPLDKGLPELDLQNGDGFYQDELHIPPLGDVNGLGEHELERVDSEVASAATEPLTSEVNVPDVLQDLWTLDIANPPSANSPHLRTWEAFKEEGVSNAERSAYLSEAGSQAFDLALNQYNHHEPDRGVLPQHAIFRAFHNLVLGRSSIFFQWNAAKRRFVPILEDVPISGYSLPSCRSFIDKMVEVGSMHRILDDYASASISWKHSCTAMIAFKGCLTSILDSVDEHITTALSSTRSLLQLQRLMELPHQLLSILSDLVHFLRDCATDDAVISRLSDRIHRIVGSQNLFTKVSQIVLARVSAPWLERLCGDIGLSESCTDSTDDRSEYEQGDNGANMSSSLLKPNSEDGHFPNFVTEDDRKLISETKAGLQVLRKHFPCADLLLAKANSLQEQIWDGEVAVAQIKDVSTCDIEDVYDEEVEQWNSRLEGERDQMDKTTGVSSLLTEGSAWADDEARHEYLSTVDARISGPLEAGTETSDRLRLATTSSLNRTPYAVTERGFERSLDLDVNPLDRLRQLIQVRGRLINKVLLRHFFRECRFIHHLDLQRQYHLLGNGDFVGRLSRALFSAETQSAERKRGTVPTSETMGLRLGTRQGQRWPPASSELRLTLAGVLTETYYLETPNHLKPSDVKELPGGLSFSIRELPDKDIERVLGSGSIYALDFIRLQYTAPPPLDAMFTKSSMQSYDDVFKFLLRLLRVLHVTTKLRERLLSHIGDRNHPRNSYRGRDLPGVHFALQAHHLTSVLMSHFMDMGIAAPWQGLVSSLTAIERTLDAPDEVGSSQESAFIGLDGLRQLHETSLETIRNRLFLRRRQEKIRNAIESLLSHILACVSIMEKKESREFEAWITKFKGSANVLLSLLRAAIDKPARTTALADAAEGDVEAMRLLLTRLSWTSSYDDLIN